MLNTGCFGQKIVKKIYMYQQSLNIYKLDIFILQLIYNFKDFKEVFWEAITEFNNSLLSIFMWGFTQIRHYYVKTCW